MTQEVLYSDKANILFINAYDDFPSFSLAPVVTACDVSIADQLLSWKSRQRYFTATRADTAPKAQPAATSHQWCRLSDTLVALAATAKATKASCSTRFRTFTCGRDGDNRLCR